MEMKVTGKAIVVGDNIDTDQIYPGCYLALTDPTEIGSHCLEGVSKEIAHSFPQGGIVVAGRNFGCGSSREHAAWALAGYGFKAVISSFFADIHKNNELNSFVLPVVVSEDFLAELFATVQADPSARVRIDVEAQTVTSLATGRSESFELNAYKKYCLLNALDDIDYLVLQQDKINAYEKTRQHEL